MKTIFASSLHNRFKSTLRSVVRKALLAGMLASAGAFCQTDLLMADEASGLIQQATWGWPEARSIEAQLESWMDQRTIADAEQLETLNLWLQPELPAAGPDTLDRLMLVIGRLDPRVSELLSNLEPGRDVAGLPEMSWVENNLPGWVRDAVRLAVGRALVQRRWYDEGLVMLQDLKVEEACDPASLLFYRAACYHHLLKKEECLADLQKLLQREKEIPSRYVVTSKLMLADMEPLKPDSLDEVARLMNDVGRRLDLGRAGKQTLDGEQQVIDKLDKLIEQIEEQMQQQQQQQQQQMSQEQQQQQQAQQTPMDDSKIAGARGPGDVDQKDIGDKSGWGNLPPAQRQEALQRITKDLPSHYREAIQDYFKKLATQPKK